MTGRLVLHLSWRCQSLSKGSSRLSNIDFKEFQLNKQTEETSVIYPRNPLNYTDIKLFSLPFHDLFDGTAAVLPTFQSQFLMHGRYKIHIYIYR